MSVNHSIWVQIVFWIVQKKALGIFDPNPEPHQYSPKIGGEIGIFRVRCRFLTFCKNRKNGFSSISFEESVLWTIWHVEKKLTIFSYHPKKISKKSDQKFWKYRILLCPIFCFTSRYYDYRFFYSFFGRRYIFHLKVTENFPPPSAADKLSKVFLF